MLDVWFTLFSVSRVFSIVYTIEVHRDESFPLASFHVVGWTGMNPLAVNKQLRKTMKWKYVDSSNHLLEAV